MTKQIKLAVAVDIVGANLLALIATKPMPKAIARVIRGEIRKLEGYSNQLASK